MTTEDQQQANAVYQANHSEAISAQRNEHANKEAHWFAMFMVEKGRADKAEAMVAKLQAKKGKKGPA